MRTTLVSYFLWLIPAVPGFAQSGGSSRQAQTNLLEVADVAPATTVVPDRLVEELSRPQLVCGTPSRPRLQIYPEGRTYGKNAVLRLQRAWRESKASKPEPQKPQTSADAPIPPTGG